MAAGGAAIRLRAGTVATAVAGAVAYGLAHRDLGEFTHIGASTNRIRRFLIIYPPQPKEYQDCRRSRTVLLPADQEFGRLQGSSPFVKGEFSSLKHAGRYLEVRGKARAASRGAGGALSGSPVAAGSAVGAATAPQRRAPEAVPRWAYLERCIDTATLRYWRQSSIMNAPKGE